MDQMARTLTQPSYIVISAIGSDAYLPEQERDFSRSTVIRDIASRQYEALTQVLEINVAAGTCKDVTREICNEVMTRWVDDGALDDDKIEWVEAYVSSQAANACRRAA